MSTVNPITDRRLIAVVQFYEHLSPGHLSQLDALYTPDAFFKDPFHEVRGQLAIAAIFHHMYASLNLPYFRVLTAMVQGDEAFVRWQFHFRFKRKPTTEEIIEGVTHIRFASDGRVQRHRDYWDAAEELYERIPGLAILMRWFKRMASSS